MKARTGCRAFKLLQYDVVVPGVRRICTVVVVMAGQGQSVAVPRDDNRGCVDPGSRVGASLSDNSGGRLAVLSLSVTVAQSYVTVSGQCPL